MAPRTPPLAGDSGTAAAANYGPRGDGSIALPGDITFRNPAKLVAFMRANPGYVWKNRQFLKTIDKGRWFQLAGYNMQGDGRRMQQFEGVPGGGGKFLRAWTYDPGEAKALAKRGVKTVTAQVEESSGTGKAPYNAIPPGTDLSLGGARSSAPASGEPVSAPGGGEAPTLDPYTQSMLAGQAMSQGTLGALAKRLLGIQAPAGTKIPLTLAGQGMTPYGPELLDAASGKSMYESSIKQLQSLIERNRQDTDANVKQIEGWYGQVGRSLATAATRDKAIQEASLSSVTDAAKSVASAIGGEANPGASMAAQAGAQGAGLVSAMGAANDEFNSDIAPLLQAEGVGRMADERTAGTRRAQDLAMQLTQTRAEQSGASGDARLQLAKLNNELKQQEAQNRISIMQANAGVDQQGFQNKTGLFGLALSLGQFGADLTKMFLPERPKPAVKPRPISPTSLRTADLAAWNAVQIQRPQTLDDGTTTANQLTVESGVRAVKSAYGLTSGSARALREAAWRSAVRAMPNVPPMVLKQYFGLGSSQGKA